MISHYTPIDVAYALAKHAPKKLSSLLEPAVGTGILLQPFEKLCERSLDRIVCVDTDQKALNQVKATFGSVAKSFEAICTDFLQWSELRHQTNPPELFDCVLMNPPFAGRPEW